MVPAIPAQNLQQGEFERDAGDCARQLSRSRSNAVDTLRRAPSDEAVTLVARKPWLGLDLELLLSVYAKWREGRNV
jgi:hypothetical protein